MAAGINVSKANLYAVVTPATGIDVSKANLYAVVSTAQKGVDVYKLLAYAVVGLRAGVDVSKALAYAVVSLRQGVNVAKVVAYVVPIQTVTLNGDGVGTGILLRTMLRSDGTSNNTVRAVMSGVVKLSPRSDGVGTGRIIVDVPPAGGGTGTPGDSGPIYNWAFA
jgi:hypothetical protein